MYTHIYSCIPMYTHIYTHVYTHVYLVYTHVILMYTPMYTHVYLMYTHVYSCILMFAYITNTMLCYIAIYMHVVMYIPCLPVNTEKMPYPWSYIMPYLERERSYQHNFHTFSASLSDSRSFI